MDGDDEDSGLEAAAIGDVKGPIDFWYTGRPAVLTCAALGLAFYELKRDPAQRPVFVLRDVGSGAELQFEGEYQKRDKVTEVVLIVPLRDSYSLGTKTYSRADLKRILSAGLTAHCESPRDRGLPFVDDWPTSAKYVWTLRFDPPEPTVDPIVFVLSENASAFVCAALGLSFRSVRQEAGGERAFILRDLESEAELVIKANFYFGSEETDVILVVPLQDVYSLGGKTYSREAFKNILGAGLTAYVKYMNGDPPWPKYSWGGVRFEPPEPVAERAAAPPPKPDPQPQAPAARVKPRRRLPILKWLLMTVGGLVAFSIVQVCIYRFVPVPVTLLMIERLAQGNGLDHRWVGNEISDNLRSAVIAAEDARFCTHNGFDYAAIKKAEAYNATHKKKRGASTISQQTAKNVFLWPDRSWVRKGFEVWYTFLIEHLWTKDRIMEVYLNSVEWGPGVYGAESASQYWFHHSARILSPAEASKLAAILPDPDKWKAVGSGRYVSKRSGSIRARARVVDHSGYDSCTVD